ncbi:MAG: type II secretion system F family protein [Acidimicrobiia bacterium]|nr:type II secretion system F family protein [Acidimicrobiia bacterium]
MNTRRLRRGGLAAVVLALVALLLSAPLAAQTSESLLTIRAVDSVDPTDVTMDIIWTGDSADVERLQLTEQGEPLDVAWEPRPADPPPAVVFVVDQSEPMGEANVLSTAVNTIREWVAEADPSTAFGIVGVGDTAVVLQDVTTNRTSIERAIERLTLRSGVDQAAMWSGVRLGAASLRSSPEVQGNLVVVTGTNDVLSGQSSAARGELRTSGAVPFVAAYTGGDLDVGPWVEFADIGGGLVRTVDDGLEINAPMDTFAGVVADDQYRLRFTSPLGIEHAEALAGEAAEEGESAAIPTPEPGEYVLTVGGEQVEALVAPATSVVGVSRVSPEAFDPSAGVAALQGTLGLVLGIIVTLVAAALGAFAIVSLFVKDDGLSSVLQPYSEGYLGPGEEGDEERSSSALMERAADLAESVAERQGKLAQAESSLERANIPLRVGEAMALYVGIIFFSTVAGLIMFGNIFGALIFGLLGAAVPITILKVRVAMRTKKFVSQLPDTLQLLSGTLRAGYSLMQGVEAVSQEIEDPMGAELRRVVTESRLGRPLDEALDQAAERMESPDFAWAVMAIRIQREVGGNLSELLLTVADTMVARERLRRDVAALTAEGRVSAVVLGILPLGLGLVMFTLNPNYTSVLITTTMGLVMLIGAGVMMLVGFLWMRKIIQIEI